MSSKPLTDGQKSALAALAEPLSAEITEDEANGLPLDTRNKEVSISISIDQFSEFLCFPKTRVGHIVSVCSTHIETPEKGFNAFIPGATDGGRKKENIVEISMLVYDIDGGISYEALKRRCEESGYLYCGYTTFSHCKTTSKIKVPDKDILTDEEAREYCASSRRHAHLQNVSVLHGGEKQKRSVKKGGEWVDDFYFEISHGPVEKFRVIFFLNEPIPISEVGADGFADIYCAFGDRVFGGPIYDEALSVITQPAFLPSKPKGSTVEHFSWHMLGELVDWRPIWEELKSKRAKRPKKRAAQRLPLSSDEKLRQIAECLEVIPANLHRDLWRKVLCIIKHETEGSTEGRELAHDWSAQSDQYTFEETEKMLDGIDEDHPNPATMGTLIFIAREYKPDFSPTTNTKKKSAVMSDDIENTFLLKTYIEQQGVECTDDGDGGFIIADPFNNLRTITVRDAKPFGHRPIVDNRETGRTVQDYVNELVKDDGARSDASLNIKFPMAISHLQNASVIEHCPYSADELALPNPGVLAECNDPVLSTVLGLNQWWSLVTIGKDVHVHNDKSGKFMKVEAFVKYNAANTVLLQVDGKPKAVPATTFWMKSPARRTYEGAGFFPQGRMSNGNIYKGPLLNQWRGFAYGNLPLDAPGDATVITDHIKTVFHQGNEDTFEWEMDYWAHLLQKPWEKPHAHILRNEPEGGTGKDIIADMFRDRIVGEAHCEILCGTKALTAKHNANLKVPLVIIGNEITWGGDHESRDILYAETGSKYRTVEPKGVDRYTVSNYTRYVLHSNSNKPVSVAPGDRRFLVLESENIDARYEGGKQSKEYQDYFKKLAAACNDPATVAAFVNMLLARDITNFNPFVAPETDAKTALYEVNLVAKNKWLVEIACTGAIEIDGGVHRLSEEVCTTVPARDVYESAKPYLTSRFAKDQDRSLSSTVGTLLAPSKRLKRIHGEADRLAKKVQDSDGEYAFDFPPLPEFRVRVARRLGLPVRALEGDAVPQRQFVPATAPANDTGRPTPSRRHSA